MLTEKGLLPEARMQRFVAEDFQLFIERDTAAWANVVKALNLQLD